MKGNRVRKTKGHSTLREPGVQGQAWGAGKTRAGRGGGVWQRDVTVAPDLVLVQGACCSATPPESLRLWEPQQPFLKTPFPGPNEDRV